MDAAGSGSGGGSSPPAGSGGRDGGGSPAGLPTGAPAGPPIVSPDRAIAYSAAAHAARDSYGRLVAVLAANTGDLALAEDALADAFTTALERWPASGIPDNPEGWLITVARNRQRDVWKSAAARASAPLDLATTDFAEPFDAFDAVDPLRIPDRRLELCFTCAHPAIDEAARTPLMLQAVLGFDAAHIAAAYAVPTATMAQRLTRAKRRIARARIPFVVPDRRDLPERLPAVLEAVYGCAAITWRDDADSLAGEARHLAVTLAGLLEREPEAWALAALVTLSLAPPRSGPYVPLEEQSPASWDAPLIDEGEAYLRRAAALRGGAAPGRFELEAAIQAVHLDRRRTGTVDWAALRTLYSALLAVAPSLGARVAAAAVIGRTDGPAAGLAALPAGGEGFQPWWATRADLLRRAGDEVDSDAAYAHAIELARDPDVRAFLAERRSELR
ncbi:RNA polymerase subunit sigma-70 [Agromyces sp. CFH 90414]|uniref:RNA polymerase subunit sigma-70 n=2 Tax=Agromyces agglutinans TaxID=2662258 RepID=A0A6I2FEA8_9MICO|nr:RNA polymerase subunit sigma-70 [Agromyces agglutinans]